MSWARKIYIGVNFDKEIIDNLIEKYEVENPEYIMEDYKELNCIRDFNLVYAFNAWTQEKIDKILEMWNEIFEKSIELKLFSHISFNFDNMENAYHYDENGNLVNHLIINIFSTIDLVSKEILDWDEEILGERPIVGGENCPFKQYKN